MIQRYPLCWPEGWKRTESYRRRNGQFNRKVTTHVVLGPQSKQLSIADAIERSHYELLKLGVKHVQDDSVISTNLRVNMSGIPRGDAGNPSDPGVAVYWERNGKRECIAIDQYYRVADNLAAIAATLEAMRAIERHGGAEILNRAFTGFAALPERASSSWRRAFGFREDECLTIDQVESKFRELAKTLHPDQGGRDDLMQELNAARQAARLELQ